MDELRYGMALLMLMTLPAGLTFWYFFHPLIHFWRRVGATFTYLFILGILSLISFGLFCFRSTLLQGDLGTHFLLFIGGFLLLGFALSIGIKMRKELPFYTLVGLQELQPETYPAQLIQSGIYARIRHPRYAEVMLGVVGWALMTQYLIGYLMIPLTWIIGYSIILLEEKELRIRFGKEYDAYCDRVPRLIPLFTKR